MIAEVALELVSVSVKYGGIAACKDVSLSVARGEIVTLIGANGAGKSSVLKSIMQLVPHAGGTVRVLGRDVKGLATHRVVELGAALVPEGRAIFGNLSVRENLLLGAFLNRGPAAIEKNLARSIQLFPRLGERIEQHAGTLSGGEQQMLAIARALMADPQLILLDEPSLGLAPKLVSQIFESITEIAKSGITILLVEQNTRLALQVAQRAYVLVTGEVVLSGACADLRTDARIREAYLGENIQA
ncbi:MAG TPA: ABC transporter ATP-binding protein [Polyangiaceae bacterium]|nr:ABC transporter ATP-binding protein [Polyangiaceae bacterium]